MQTIHLNLTASFSPAQLRAGVLTQVAAHLARALRSGFEADVRRRVGDELLLRMRASPQYQALAGLALDPELSRGQVGEPNAAVAAEQMVQGLKASMVVAVDPPRATPGGLAGGVLVGVSRDDFDDVLAQPLSRFTSGGHNVDWLRWLLLEGDTVVVSGFEFVSKPRHAKFSRTGTGIMVRSKDPGWKVPDRLAGTKADNWVTQLLRTLEAAVFAILEEELRRRL